MILTVTGIDEAIATLERAERIDVPIHKGIERAMARAKILVLTAYGSQSDSGNTDFAVTIEELPNGFVLTASGGDVGFLEFGAGWGVMPDEFAAEVDFDVAVGSYSDIEMGQFFRTGHRFWWYVDGTGQKQFFRYVNPTRGMQEALDYLRSNLQRIVEEEITKWIGN